MRDVSICVVGLGYVGLPLAVSFGRTDYPTYGYDLNSKKIEILLKGVDPMGELTEEEMRSSRVEFSDRPEIIQKANVIIAAIPTPVDDQNCPDLEPVKSASRVIGQHLQKGSVVVFESTVYPGVTEEICAPILEETSGLKYGVDFQLGYSPERINPGDKEHTLEKITKIVSASTPETLKLLSEVYGRVVKAGIYEAPSIKVAEAAKVIENIQRDLNIALMNELSIIFHKLGIDTIEVLKAAETKWNFHSYRPGLVGGHCIGVDPYYLTHRAQTLGYQPEIILSGRKLNDSMSKIVAGYVKEGLKRLNRPINSSKVLILGLTFKENVADIRNSKVVDLIHSLQKDGITVVGYDPLISVEVIKNYFGVQGLDELNSFDRFDAMVLASPHKIFENQMQTILKLGKAPLYFMDLKGNWKTFLQDNQEILYQSL